MDLEAFKTLYEDAEWLEDYGNFERWTNGLGEGSLDESVWFCSECGEEVTDLFDPDCSCYEEPTLRSEP